MYYYLLYIYYLQIENVKNSDAYKTLSNLRYHSYSDYDQSKQYVSKALKPIALWLVLRELPLKNFYARSFINAYFFIYLVYYNWKTFSGLIPMNNEDKIHFYSNKFDEDTFANYPLLKRYVCSKRVIKTDSPGLVEHFLWNEQQYEPFYMHHMKHYRYIFRNRRVVQWDGTYNQPIYPYLSNNDRASYVHNGVNEIFMPSINPSW